MEQTRWQQVEQIYLSLRGVGADLRDLLLAEACGDDEELRREIRALLAQETERGCLLDRNVFDAMGTTFAAGQRADVRNDPFPPGTLLAERFRILRVAGAGGMGYVYEARDEQLDLRVALKCAKPGYLDRLPPEVRAAREVSHFNVCKVHDLHVASTPLGKMEFLSMEYIEGQTLAERIKRDGPIPEQEARQIARQICAGLGQAHRQGVIHGDLKPGNVLMVDAAKTSGRVVLADFGIASIKVVEGDSAKGFGGGTPDFMAPELFMGQPTTVASDVYALGILFHNMLKGHPPKWIGKPVIAPKPMAHAVDSQAKTITTEPTIIPGDWHRALEDLPQPWATVVARCTAAHPEDRYDSAEAVSQALEPRRRALKAGFLVASIAAVALGYWQWSAPPAGAPVRLAVLPFAVDGDPVPGVGGIGLDVAERLSGARRNFTVISPREAQRNGVETPPSAKSILGATHVLETRLRHSGTTIVAAATLTDLESGRTLGQPLEGTYAADDTAGLAKAILATVTSGFQLRARAPAESVSAAAYEPYVQGVELLRQDDYNSDKAIPYFEKAIALDPKSALPYAGLADAQIRKYDKREGSEWLKTAAANVAKAEAINADSVPVLLVSGAYQEKHGSYEPALRAFNRATELDPNNPEAWRRLAGVYEEAGRTDEAIATYRRAMKAQPSYYGNYLGLGNLYWYRGEFRDAEQLYRNVTAVAPNLSSGHMDLGLALMEQGRFREAEESLRRALSLHRSSLALMNMGGVLYAEERYREAAQFFKESVMQGAASAVQYKDLGDVYRHLNRRREAAAAYRSARDLAQDEVTRNPRQADSRVLLALISAQLGDAREARFEAEQALSMEPGNAIVMHEAVVTYEVLQQREDALRVLRRAPQWLLEELSHQPDVKSLQQDPRFQALIQQQRPR